MSLKIYTYSNPYELKREEFWSVLKECPQLCVSQTMVNGFSSAYPELRRNMVTFWRFLNELYNNWEDRNTRMKQMMEVDNAIYLMQIEGDDQTSIKRSLEYNAKNLASCIRLFKELDMSPDQFDTSLMNIDQKYLLDIYHIICAKEKSYFRFVRALEEEQIDNAIRNALKNDLERLDTSTVVIHGVHQFTPAMLCAIEDMCKYKNVILLFNYQEQYSSVYKTWLDIYSLFEVPINISNRNKFRPVSLMVQSYPCNVLADSVGTLSNGEYKDASDILSGIEVVEFDNLTEFAGYCAMLYEEARNHQEKSRELGSTLKFMPEQMYSASGKVNDILRAYFPEQFGERHFLDYPIGHFFVSALEMWDNQSKCVVVDDTARIKECLSAGIISEKRNGQLLSSFNCVEPYIVKESKLNGIIESLKRLRKYVGKSRSDFRRIGYLNMPKDELKDLIKALEELNDIIKYFFEDFDEEGDNFNRFYRKIHDFIVKRVEDMDDLDEEIKEVISRLVQRIGSVDLPDTGTYVCLKQTLSYYLSQDDSVDTSANWIVRNFEQIDGDVLLSGKADKRGQVYHFCCLSDNDICSAKDERIPWPLDISFFEYSYGALDKKYRLFLKSKMEFQNFRRYALIYGLEFNRAGFKLSYVRNDGDKENEMYHIFRLLGVKSKRYQSIRSNPFVPRISYAEKKLEKSDFGKIDVMRYNICPYKFALESVVQGETIFRERFLMIHYLRRYLENMIKTQYEGKRINYLGLQAIVSEKYDELDDKFHISNEFEKAQIVFGVYKSLRTDVMENGGRFPLLTPNQKEYLKLSEDFLYMTTKGTDTGDMKSLIEFVEKTSFYNKNTEHNCMYCASKDICLRNLQ